MSLERVGRDLIPAISSVRVPTRSGFATTRANLPGAAATRPMSFTAVVQDCSSARFSYSRKRLQSDGPTLRRCFGLLGRSRQVRIPTERLPEALADAHRFFVHSQITAM